ncbi:MAG: LLM class F420-dependent oxidoreductase [Candidatus Dormiibacterota bacterium]
MDLGEIGIWSGRLRGAAPAAAVDAAKRIEALGFGTAWLSSGAPGQLEQVRALVGGTSTLTVATGILNVYTEADPAKTAATFHEIDVANPGRVLLGIGIGHAQSLPAGAYGPPLPTIGRYLDQLDAAPNPVPVERRALAALRPRMLRLSKERSLGAHPYLTSPAHTREAREILGADSLLAPEQGVVLETDPTRARAVARLHLGRYLTLTNYVNSFRHLGFGDADFEHDGSDRLVDEIIAWGDLEAIAARVRAHLAAGATHVALQVLTETPDEFPVAAWERLAGELLR